MSSKIIAGTTSGTALNFSADTSGTLEIQTGSGPTTAITIDANQRSMFPTTIGVGGATPSTTGAGISFPATQSFSSDANTLDDYEEGTWSPTITAGAGSITSYSASGTYVKIGRTVILNGNYTVSNNGTGSGFGQIGNFPFTVSNMGASGSTRIGGTTGNQCSIDIGTGSVTSAAIWTYNNGYPWANNAQGPFTIVYQVA